jgi:hypothetical protein
VLTAQVGPLLFLVGVATLARKFSFVIKKMLPRVKEEESMKRSAKSKRKRLAKRELFAELSEGMDALADVRRGKRTLRTHLREFKPAPTIKKS